MIALTIGGCCNGCPHIDLELIPSYEVTGCRFDDSALCPIKTYSLRCRHEKVCGILHEEMLAHPLAPDPEG